MSEISVPDTISLSPFKYDAFGNIEDLNLTLCNPGCYVEEGRIHRAISSIPYVTDLELTTNYNGMSEINFRVHCVEDDTTDRNRTVISIFNMISENRYIHVGNYVGNDIFFRISECEYTCENGERYKDVKAVSRGCELTTRNVPFIEAGLYKLCDIRKFSKNDFCLGFRDGFNASKTDADNRLTLVNQTMHFDRETVISPLVYMKMFVCKQDGTSFWTKNAIIVEKDSDITISLARSDDGRIGHYDISLDEFVVTDADIERVTSNYTLEETDTIMYKLFGGSDWGYAVDDSHAQTILNNRLRYFDGSNDAMSIYDFLIEKVQQAYECIFTFSEGNSHGEIHDETHVMPYQTGVVDINLYDTVSDPIDEHIFLSKDTFIISGRRSTESMSVYTSMRGVGSIIDSSSVVSVSSDGSIAGMSDSSVSIGSSSDKMFTIASVNPIGGNVVYDFSRYYDWMTEGLRDAVIAWQGVVAANEEAYIGYARSYYEASYHASEIQRNIDMYNIRKDIYSRCINNLNDTHTLSNVPTYNQQLVAVGEQPIVIDEATTVSSLANTINGIISGINDAINEEQAEKNVYEATMSQNKAEMDAINNACSFESNFTNVQFNELVGYMKEAEYRDDCVAYSLDMPISEQMDAVEETYRRTKNALVVASEPIYQYDIEVDGYMYVSDFNKASFSGIRVGSIIHADIDGLGYQTLFVTEASYNFEDKTFRLSVASTLVRSDIRSLFRSVFDSISDAYTTQYRLTSR